MGKVNLIALALVTVCLFAVPLASGQGGSVEQQISALSDQMIQAQLKADTSYLEKHYAADAVIIHGDGEPFTKAKEVAELQSGSLKYELNEVRDRKIYVYGDTAIVAFLISYKGTVSGKPFTGDLRRTVVWVKQKGNWNIVAYQVTRLGWQAVTD
jgi:ketosteroid isomerase-like protein